MSRTAHRHPHGNAFIERMFRTLKEEAIWTSEFDTHDQALATIMAWIQDYNAERPHASMGDRTLSEAAQHKNSSPTVNRDRGNNATQTLDRALVKNRLVRKFPDDEEDIHLDPSLGCACEIDELGNAYLTAP
ncbi:transposase [bacterium]|nr:transposase [bacterium]